MAIIRDSRELVALVGEYYTLFRLAQEGVRAYKLHDRYDYDLLTTADTRIEVKTANKISKPDRFRKANGLQTRRDGWLFANHTAIINNRGGIRTQKLVRRVRSCDFYVLVCVNGDSKTVERSYVIPNSDFTFSQTIWIPKDNTDTMHTPYLERWDLILSNDIGNAKLTSDLTAENNLRVESVIQDTYSTSEVAEMIGIPGSYVTVWCRDGEIESIPQTKYKGRQLYRVTQKGLAEAIKKSEQYSVKKGKDLTNSAIQPRLI